MNFSTGINKETGFPWIEMRSQADPEYQWLMAFRHGPGQRIEFYETGDPVKYGLRVVNDTPPPKSARPVEKGEEPPKPTNYAGKSIEDLLTIIAEKGLPTPAPGTRKGDLVKLLNEHQAA